MVIDIKHPGELQQAILATKGDELLILAFWAPWSQPCKTLAPVLESMAAKYAPRIRIARINIDEHRALAQQLRVQNVPAVKFVYQGQVAAQFNGAQPASVIEEYIKQILPPPEEEVSALDQAHDAIKAGRWDIARRTFEMLAKKGDDKTAALLGLARCHIHFKDAVAARAALDQIADSAKADEIARLRLVISLVDTSQELGGLPTQAARIQAAPGDWSAVFDWAVCLAVDGQYDAACEALLRIIEHDRNFKQGEPRKILVGLFAVLGNDSLQVREFRARLSSALFS